MKAETRRAIYEVFISKVRTQLTQWWFLLIFRACTVYSAPSKRTQGDRHGDGMCGAENTIAMMMMSDVIPKKLSSWRQRRSLLFALSLNSQQIYRHLARSMADCESQVNTDAVIIVVVYIAIRRILVCEWLSIKGAILWKLLCSQFSLYSFLWLRREKLFQSDISIYGCFCFCINVSTLCKNKEMAF